MTDLWRKQTFRIFAAALAAALPLAACSMDTDTYTMLEPQKRVALRHENQSVTVPTARLGDGALWQLVDHYRHYGTGTADITVTYDPKSKTNTAMTAAAEAGRISNFLRRKGMTDIAVDILPVHNAGDVSQTMISYGTVAAEAPEGCATMGGLDGKMTQADEDYPIGCTVETMLSRQIARPQDLAGRAGLDVADGRRQTNVLEGGYREAVPNTLLQGESASQ